MISLCTLICLKIKFRPVIELIACTFRLHQAPDYTIWLSIEFLPFWQRLPLKPGGHKHRYLSTVNPDWQVPPFKQLNSSQAFLKEKQRRIARWLGWSDIIRGNFAFHLKKKKKKIEREMMLTMMILTVMMMTMMIILIMMILMMMMRRRRRRGRRAVN